MELTIQVNPVDRTARLREVHALAAGDSCSVVLEGVRGADAAALRLALYRDAASGSPVASCPSFAPVRGHPNLATGDLRLDTSEMAAWFEAVRPEPEGSATGRDGPGSGDAAERAVRTDGWLVVSEPTRTWAACRVPVVLRPGAGVSGVVDPTSIQSLVEGLVSATMSEALASKADKATTLAGYGIADAATKTELDAVDQRAANAISGVQSELSEKADLVDGKVPANQLPSYVDDVLEYDAVSAFPSTGEDGKIYVAKDTNKTYRWGGTQYVEISQSLALGETAETAYPGDKGKTAAEMAANALTTADSAYTVAGQAMHDTAVHAENKDNPHKVTAAQVGALPLKGGTLTGDLALGEEHAGSRTLSIASDNGANGIKLQGGTSYGKGSRISIGGSSGDGGVLDVNGGMNSGGTVIVSASTGGGGGTIEVQGSYASIKKDGKEVATEEQVNAVSGKVDAISATVNVDNRLLVDDTTASVQTRTDETAEFADEIRFDKGYDPIQGSAMVRLDKSVQTVSASGGSLGIVLPDAVDGTVRDLCVYVNNNGADDAVLAFPAGTYYGDDPNAAVSKAGAVTAVYLTEIPGGAWMLRITKLEQYEVTV